MTDISVHYTKKEGKPHSCNQGRVGLSESGDAIGVNHLLEEPSKLICLKISRRF